MQVAVYAIPEQDRTLIRCSVCGDVARVPAAYGRLRMLAHWHHHVQEATRDR